MKLFGAALGCALPAYRLGLLAIALTCATEAVAADSPKDLGTVLADQKDLSTYYNLIKVGTVPRATELGCADSHATGLP